MNNMFHVPRIHKLRVLAQDRGATPAERETAGRMANQLMAKYHITEDDIDNAIPPAVQAKDYAEAWARSAEDWRELSKQDALQQLGVLRKQFIKLARCLTEEEFRVQLALLHQGRSS